MCCSSGVIRGLSWAEVWRRVAEVGAYWLTFMAFLVTQQYSVLNANGQWRSWGEDGTAIVLWFVPWIPLSVFILFAAVRLRLSEYRPGRNVALLVSVAAVAGFVRLGVHVALNALGLTATPPVQLSWSVVGTFVASAAHREFLNAFLVTACFAAHETYRAAVERSRSSAILQARLSEAELRHLRAQLHPHFLFNALNAVTTLIRKDPAAAETTMGNLSELLRRALDDGEGQMVTVARELEFLERYLAIQNVRFGDRLRTRIDAPADVRDARIPSMILQPLVENAVRHSIARREGGSIAVIVESRNADMLLSVTDDGKGMRGEETGAGVGIANVRSRIEHLFGGRAEIRILNVPGAFTVELRLPREAS